MSDLFSLNVQDRQWKALSNYDIHLAQWSRELDIASSQCLHRDLGSEKLKNERKVPS